MIIELLQNLLILFLFALIIVFLFSKIKISPIIGFLFTGFIVGPSGIGLVKNYHLIGNLAEVGIIFLLFVIGIEFSIKKLIAYRKEILLAGLLQISLIILITFILSYFLLKTQIKLSLFFGFLLAMSSTALVLKILMDRGELNTTFGRLAFGILIFQDLCAVIIIFLIPILGGQIGSFSGIILNLGKSFFILGCVFIATFYIFPFIFHQIVKTRNRELFLITILVLSLGTALFSYKLGLSLALGAFLGGLVISESEYALQTMAEIKPFKDLLMAIFFISIGLLLKPEIIYSYLGFIIFLIFFVFIIKFLATLISAFSITKNLRISLLTSFILAQIGEFSLILALEGKKYGLLEEKWYQIFIASSVTTLFATPFLIGWAHKLTDIFLEKISYKSYLRFKKKKEEIKESSFKDHTIVVGFGVGGQNIVYGLKTLNLPYVIIDLNPNTVKIYKAKNEPIFFGDATNVEILRRLGIQQAKALAIVIGDYISARKIVQIARRENPHIYIIVRTKFIAEIEDFIKLGANEVIPEDFEASIEIFAKLLHYYKIPRNIIFDVLEDIRKNHYQALRTLQKPELKSIEELEFLKNIATETYLIKKGSPLIGISLKTIDLRSKTGATVIAIKRNEEFLINPSPNFIFKEGDLLIIIGTDKQLNKALAILNNPFNFPI